MVVYHGVVERGVVRLPLSAVPDGTEVVVVAPTKELPSVEEQIARLKAIPPEERRKAFDEFVRFADQEAPPEVDIASVSDEELVAIVHEIRAERMAEREHVSRH